MDEAGLKQAIEHLAGCEDLCGTSQLTEHFEAIRAKLEAIRAKLYEQLGRLAFDAE